MVQSLSWGLQIFILLFMSFAVNASNIVTDFQRMAVRCVNYKINRTNYNQFGVDDIEIWMAFSQLVVSQLINFCAAVLSHNFIIVFVYVIDVNEYIARKW